MYCPLLRNKPTSNEVAFGQCLEAACAWWSGDDTTGKCAICQIGIYAAEQTES